MLRRNRPYYFYPILFIYLYIFHPFIPIVDLCYASEYHIFKVGLLQWNKYLYHTPFVPNYSSLLLHPKSNFFNFDRAYRKKHQHVFGIVDVNIILHKLGKVRSLRYDKTKRTYILGRKEYHLIEKHQNIITFAAHTKSFSKSSCSNR